MQQVVNPCKLHCWAYLGILNQLQQQVQIRMLCMKATSCFLELAATIACQKQSFVVYVQLSKVWALYICYIYNYYLSFIDRICIYLHTCISNVLNALCYICVGAMLIKVELLFLLSLFLLFLLLKDAQGRCSSCPSNACSQTGKSQGWAFFKMQLN